MSKLSKAVVEFENAAKAKSNALRSRYRPWGKIQKKLIKVIGEHAKAEDVPLYEPGPHGRRKDVAVDWSLQDNLTTMFAVILSTLWQYTSVALTNGPFSYEYEKISNSSQQVFDNVTQELTWREELFQHNETAFIPYVVDLVMFVPKFQLPPYYVSWR